MKDMRQQLHITVVPTEVLDVVWTQVKPMIEMAIKTTRPRYDINSVRYALDNGELLLWLVLDGTEPVAALTTRIADYPHSRGLCLDWIGGKRMREWLPMAHDIMRKYAYDNDCTHLEGYGRKAWGRWLEKYGWEPEYTAFRMELKNG